MDARTFFADGAGARERLNGWGKGPAWASVDAQKCADSLGARKKLEMGGEKGRWASASVDARTCADGVGEGKNWKWVGRRAGGHERAWVRGRVGARKRLEMGAWMHGRLQTVWVQGKGWKWVGRRTGGHERAWMRGRVRTVRVQGRLEMGGEMDRWA